MLRRSVLLVILVTPLAACEADELDVAHCDAIRYFMEETSLIDEYEGAAEVFRDQRAVVDGLKKQRGNVRKQLNSHFKGTREYRNFASKLQGVEANLARAEERLDKVAKARQASAIQLIRFNPAFQSAESDYFRTRPKLDLKAYGYIKNQNRILRVWK